MTPFQIHRESMPLVSIYGTRTTPISGSQGIINKTPQPTSMWAVDAITVSTNQAVEIKVELISTGYTISTGIFTGIQGPTAGGMISLPLPSFFVDEGQTLNVSINGTTTDPFIFRAGVIGKIISSDMAIEARHRMLCVGDSITAGTGITAGENHFSFKVRDFLMQQTGRTWRCIRKAESSFTSSHVEVMRRTGKLNVEAPSLIQYALGMNDTDAAVYDANLTKFLAWANARYPKAVVMVCGPTRRTDANETIMAAIRANAQARIAAIGNPRNIYVEQGNIWDVSNQTGANARTTDGIHPNDLGQSEMGTAQINALNANAGRSIAFML